MGLIAWAASEPQRPQKWEKAVWDKLAFCARYGHVSPGEAASWELTDLTGFARSLAEIVEQEHRLPPGTRHR